MAKPPLKNDREKDDMAKDDMAKDDMAKDDMAKEIWEKDDMAKDDRAKEIWEKDDRAKEIWAKQLRSHDALKARMRVISENAPKLPLPKQPTRGLGRGLSSLLGDAGIAAATAPPESTAGSGTTKAANVSGELAGAHDVIDIPVEWINSGPWQPRIKFDKEALNELADSIKQKGIMQPVLVRKNPNRPQRYQLIAGERRWRAAQLAQLHTVPAILREINDLEAFELSLIENVQRSDLSAIEESLSYQRLITTYGYKQNQISDLIGKSRSYIANILRLLTLPRDVMVLVADGQLTMGQVRPLIGHKDASKLANEIIEGGMSARQVEKLVKRKRIRIRVKGDTEKPADILALEQRAAEKLGLSMNINWDESKKRGKLVFDCNDFTQISYILTQLGLD